MPSPDQSSALLRGIILAATILIPPARLTLIAPTPAEVSLFRVVTIRSDLILGLTTAEIAALGRGSEIERLARRFAEASELTAWKYMESRGPDGASLLTTRGRVSVSGRDALLIEGFVAGMPVLPPPA